MSYELAPPASRLPPPDSRPARRRVSVVAGSAGHQHRFPRAALGHGRRDLADIEAEIDSGLISTGSSGKRVSSTVSLPKRPYAPDAA